jgi:hypothetical protein
VQHHSNVEKHDEHALSWAAALPHLRPWGSWALPLWRLLFSLGITPVDPTLAPVMTLSQSVAALTRVEEIQRGSQNVLGTLREQDFQHAFQQWQRRWSRCVDAQGDYFKRMLPKLKSSKYILVYRSSVGTFWYTLVYVFPELNRNVPNEFFLSSTDQWLQICKVFYIHLQNKDAY